MDAIPWKILTFETKSGEKPVDLFIQKQQPQARSKIIHNVRLLQEYGNRALPRAAEWESRWWSPIINAEHLAMPRDTPLKKTLFACDEMAGFITAASLVRPSKSILDLEARSVVRRMKDKAFARGVKREDLRAGAEVIGLPLEEHIANVIAFMRERADALGLRGSL